MKKHTNYSVILGQALRQLRKAQGLRQQVAAEVLGISLSMVSRRETGNTEMSVKEFRRLCQLYGKGVSPVYLWVEDLVRVLETNGIMVTDLSPEGSLFLPASSLGPIIKGW